jgi:hypothetical protein
MAVDVRGVLLFYREASGAAPLDKELLLLPVTLLPGCVFVIGLALMGVDAVVVVVLGRRMPSCESVFPREKLRGPTKICYGPNCLSTGEHQ